MKHMTMKARRAVAAGLLIFGVTLLGSGGPSLAQTSGATHRYVVVFRGAVPSGVQRLVEAAGGTLTRVLPEVGIAIARSDQLSFPGMLAARSAAVRAVGEERGRALPARAAFDFESHEVGPTPVDDLFTTRQWHIRRVRADAAWPITAGSSDIVVAVIDNGVASNHPDLAPNLQFSACYSSGPACSIYPEIPFSAGGLHGTMVAGVIAASFGHGRVVGVGPNLGLASYNVFELDPEEGFVAFEDSIWAAMLDAAARGFRVINLSLGNLIVFPANEAAMWTAWNRVAQYVTRQGVTIVASAGNDGISVNGPVAHLPSDLPSVIGVGATAIRPNPEYPQAGAIDIKAVYSNNGAALTLTAPGGDCGPSNPECAGVIPTAQTFFWIQSSAVMPGVVIVNGMPVPSPGCIATASCAVGYTRLFGTSLAAPHVAAVAGLILSQNPSLNPHQVAAILKQTAQPLGDRQLFGHGMVDAAAAVGAP